MRRQQPLNVGESYSKVIAARAARAGVPIITGTDVLERHGDMLLLELVRLVDIGLTAQQVLVAATLTSAEAAQRPELGRVMASRARLSHCL